MNFFVHILNHRNDSAFIVPSSRLISCISSVAAYPLHVFAISALNTVLMPYALQHELSHFLAFKKPLHNRMLSIISNCVLVVPTATTFRKYHQEHHSHLVSITRF